MTEGKFVAVDGQFFHNHQDWVNRASRVLTNHPEFHDTQHPKKKGWTGYHFTALCFDQQGRRVRNGLDFQKAAEDGAFPVWWVWPDQLAELLMKGLWNG